MNRRLGLVLGLYYLLAVLLTAVPPSRCDGHGRPPHPAAGLARCLDSAGTVWLCRTCWSAWATEPPRRRIRR